MFNESLDGGRHRPGDGHLTHCEQRLQIRYDQVALLRLEAVEGRIQKLGLQHPHGLESIKSLIELYEAWNKPEKAAHWRAKLSSDEDANE